MMMGWLVYRMDTDGEPEFFGVYKTREAAQLDIDTMNDDDWLVESLPFVGFGIAIKQGA
jgi:hypothetical protein